MIKDSFIKNKILNSPLATASTLKPKGRARKRNVTATLLLTSLVDAFSILVIFLMMNSATEQSDFEKDPNLNLPKASQATSSYKTTLVKIMKNQIYVNQQLVPLDQLLPVLTQIHNQISTPSQTHETATSEAGSSLVVIADRDMDFATLNPILVLGSRAGFSELKFAVERISSNNKKN